MNAVSKALAAPNRTFSERVVLSSKERFDWVNIRFGGWSPPRASPEGAFVSVTAVSAAQK